MPEYTLTPAEWEVVASSIEAGNPHPEDALEPMRPDWPIMTAAHVMAAWGDPEEWCRWLGRDPAGLVRRIREKIDAARRVQS